MHTLRIFFNGDFQETIAKSNVITLSKVKFRLTGKKFLIMKCILLQNNLPKEIG